MKTKYILHGGLAHIPNEMNDLFFKEILKDTPENLNILLVLFSKENERVLSNSQEDVDQFNRNKGGKNINFEVARVEDFVKQSKKSDILYFHGGSTPMMIGGLSKINNLSKCLEGKIIGAESAGMNALSAYCYSFLLQKVIKGLGILSLKAIPHFDGVKGIKEMEKIAPELEKLYLPEFKYKVFFK